MPYLTNLAEIARSAGLTVVEQAGWRTRGHGAMVDVRAVVCHHTAGPKTGDAPSLSIVQNGRSDLPGPLAHFVLARSGVVYVVAAGQCWHTGSTLQTWQSNAHAIGIEAEATGVDPWPEAQLVAYAKLCAALARAFGLSSAQVLGHKEVCAPVGRKIDPNFDMAAFRTRVVQYMSGQKPVDPVTDTEDEEDMAELKAGNRSGSFSCLGKRKMIISTAYENLKINQCVGFGTYGRAGDKNQVLDVMPDGGYVTDHYPWVVDLPANIVSVSLWWELSDPNHQASIQFV